MKTTIDGRWPLMEDNFLWYMTCTLCKSYSNAMHKKNFWDSAMAYITVAVIFIPVSAYQFCVMRGTKSLSLFWVKSQKLVWTIQKKDGRGKTNMVHIQNHHNHHRITPGERLCWWWALWWWALVSIGDGEQVSERWSAWPRATLSALAGRLYHTQQSEKVKLRVKEGGGHGGITLTHGHSTHLDNILLQSWASAKRKSEMIITQYQYKPCWTVLRINQQSIFVAI